MADDFFCELDGRPCRSVRVEVPWTGAWMADVHLQESASDLPSKVTLQVGDTQFRGTIDPGRTGTFADDGRAVVVGGAGGWGKPVAKLWNHNDAMLKRSQIATALAREVGETLVIGSEADKDPFATHFMREICPASRVLEQLFPALGWWVGQDGVTKVGTRTTRDVTGSATILNYDASQKFAELAIEDRDVSVVLPGCSIDDPIHFESGDPPFVVHDVTIDASPERLRAYAYGGTSRDSRALRIFRALVRESDPNRTFRGMYRYRVFSMSGDRVQLQVVNPNLGLDDALPVEIAPGMAGLAAQLTPGAVVLVQFVEGDPTMPVVTHFTRKDEEGFLPVQLTLDATSLVAMGFDATSVELGLANAKVLRDGEAVKITATGTVTPGGPSGAITVTGIIQLDPAIAALPPAAPPAGPSKVKA